MTRIERGLGILLALSGGATVTAGDLARRFEVSVRTIYRDVEALSLLGIPVYAERGAAGGFRLMEGFFLPPVAFSRNEAVAILLAMALVRSLRTVPLAPDLEAAERKLVGVLPRHLRPLMGEAQRFIGFERAAADAFHPEPDHPARGAGEAAAVDTFLKAVLDRVQIVVDYRSPYAGGPSRRDAAPLGLLWDRDHWYLIGRPVDREEPRFWRADRVRAVAATTIKLRDEPPFDVRALLGRAWLGRAMAGWAAASPARIRLTRAQAERLAGDWYYGHAAVAADGDGHAVMTLGEGDAKLVFELLRWLGPDAELLEPVEWRARFGDELRAMAARYDAPVTPTGAGRDAPGARRRRSRTSPP